MPVLLVAVFMTTLDFFVANVAVPSIRAGLGAGAGVAQFVVAGYGLAYAAGLIVSGRLGDLYGPRRVFAIGLALFTLASAVCGAAPSAGVLVAARVAQGVAAALLAPQVLTLLGMLFEGRARVRVFGWYGTAVGLAGVSGQAIGGLLVAADPLGLGWRACFLINVPVGLAALALTPRLIPAPARSVRASGQLVRASGRLDWVGAGLVAGGLVAVVLPLVQGREQGWPAWVWVSLAGAAVLLAAFVRRQRTLAAAGREPLLELGVFRERGFAAGLAAVASLFGASAGLSFVLALYLQDGLGLSPLAAGTVGTALNAGFFAASLRAGRTGKRTGALVLVTGLAMLHQAVGAGAGPYWLAGALAVAGVGMGLLMSPLISRTLAAVRPARAGAAAGVLGTVQEAGSVLGGTLTGTVLLASLDGGDWTTAAQAGLAVSLTLALAVLCVVTRRDRARRRARAAGIPPTYPASLECSAEQITLIRR